MVARSRLRPRAIAPAVLAAGLTAGLIIGGGPGAAASMSRPYLALGDSIAFGYVFYPSAPNSALYDNADNFTGYPTYVAEKLGLDVVDAACPGESTGSFITLGAPDNGCQSYLGSHPLHVAYPGLSQLEFADAFLESQPNTQLVTLGLGTNDAMMIRNDCATVADPDGCYSRQLAGVTINLDIIVTSLRDTGYRGPIVLVDDYSTDYGDAAVTVQTGELNAAIGDAAVTNHLATADAFTVFGRAASASAGHTCAAGLVTPVADSPACDLHPTAAGQQLIAAAVERAYAEATH